MKTIKIKFLFKEHLINWYQEYFTQIMGGYFNFEISDNPDFVFFNNHEQEFINYDCIRISFAQENFRPDFNVADYSIGFDHINFLDRYIRYPLFLLYKETFELSSKKHLNINSEILVKKINFCNFIVSNGNASETRTKFFKALSEKQFIHSGGGYMNNIGGRVEDKLSFQSSCKFSICFENSKSPGYLTEKLFHAVAAQTIPIYWGDPTIFLPIHEGGYGINPKSCIYVNDEEDFYRAIDLVMQIDSNDDLFYKYLSEPLFFDLNYREVFDNNLKSFLLNIFEQDLVKVARRSKGQVEKKNEYSIKKIKQLESTSELVNELKTRLFKKII